MASATDPLVWLDMEMSGLDPATCVPLEVAIIITSADLTEIDTFHTVIHQDDPALESMNDFVRDMHTGNGLLERVRASTTTLAEADRGMAEIVLRHCEAGTAVLSGNSIHQDRKFIVAYFPDFEKLLHYRMVDVSTIKELVRRWYGNHALYAKPQSDHTALADTRESIAELGDYRRRFLVPPGRL